MSKSIHAKLVSTHTFSLKHSAQDLEVLPPQATADRLLEAAPLQHMFRIVVLHMGPQCRCLRILCV